MFLEHLRHRTDEPMGGKKGMLNQTKLLSGLEGIRSKPLPGQRPGVCPREVDLDFTALTKHDHPRAKVVS